MHGDQTHGINDLRSFYINSRKQLDVYADKYTSKHLKNSLDLQDTFKSIPMDNILIETDSPFLAPVPKRGKKNEPSFIDFTAAKLAKIKNLSKEDLIKKTTDNFNKLFFNSN